MNAQNARSLATITMAEAFLNSSSSSSDEYEYLKHLDKDAIPKVANYEVIVNQYSENEFKRHFRMQRDTYNSLKNKFETSTFNYEAKNHPGLPGVNCNVQLLAFLWYAGNKCVIRDVASRFNVADSTMHKIITHVMDFILDLGPQVIQFPRTEELKHEAAAAFRQISGFPNVIGCVDGSYIPIRTPAGKIKSTYVNRHDLPALTLQGICDAERRFIDVFTGPPGKIHDARVYKLSFIGGKLQTFCDNGEPWHILADAAYPLRKWIITPFRDYGDLTNTQRNFNYKLSATRVRVENCFGVFKQRFRQLKCIDMWSVDRMSKFIISCCVLHNICINNNDLWEEDYVPEQNIDLLDAEQDHIEQREGAAKRDALCDLLNDENQ